MISFLKTKTVTLEGIGELTIRELPAAAQLAIIEAKDDPNASLFIVCKYGAFQDKTVEELKNMMTMQQATLIAAEIFQLSGLNDTGDALEPSSKNSETGQAEGSSSS